MDTRIQTATIRTEGADRPVLRLGLAQALGRVDFRPPGVPPSAVLRVRRLVSPKPLRLGRHDPEWEAALRGRLLELYDAAARPIRCAVVPGTDAVLFADAAELVACFLVTAGSARRTSTSPWWACSVPPDVWPDPLRADAGSADTLRADPRYAPAVLAHLARAKRLDDVMASTGPEEIRTLVTEIAAAFRVPAPWKAGAPPQVPGRSRSPTPEEQSALGPPAVRDGVRWALRLHVRSPSAPALPTAMPPHGERAVRDERPGREVRTGGTEPRSASQAERPSAEVPTAPVRSEDARRTGDEIVETPSATEGLDQPEHVPSPETTTTRQPDDPPEPCSTALAGTFYLVHVMRALDLPASFEETWGLDRLVGAWGTLELLARGLSGAGQDPLWEFLAGIDGRSPGELPGSALPADVEFVPPPEWPEERIRAPVVDHGLKPGARRWLEGAAGHAGSWIRRALERTGLLKGDPLRELLVRPGVVYASRTHVDVVMPLAAISLPVRAAGLDRDPGWEPAFGRVLSFHFEG